MVVAVAMILTSNDCSDGENLTTYVSFKYLPSTTTTTTIPSQIQTTTFIVSEFEVDNGVTNQVVRGVKAKTSIRDGDELVSVPENMLFTSSRIAKRWPRVYNLPHFRKNVVLELGHSKKVALLSYGLWLERFGNKTKWRDPNIDIDLEPFLKSLPERAKEVEISNDELKQLQCHDPHWCNLIATMTKNSIEYVESAFDMIETSLRRDGANDLIPDFMQYVDAYSVVNSRCFQANGVDEEYPEFVPGNTDTVALAPLCGFFNHHDHIHDVSTFGYDKETRRFVVRADRSYEANEQVFIRYGRLDNANLVHHYSFVLPNNKYENLKVPVSQMQVTPNHVEVSAMLKTWKLELLQDLATFSDKESETLHINVTGAPDDVAVVGLRIRALCDSDVFRKSSDNDDAEPILLLRQISSDLRKANEGDEKAKIHGLETLKSSRFGLENEIAVWTEYVRFSLDRLKIYPTTLGDDISKLQSIRALHQNDNAASKIVERKWLLVVQRIEEKVLLHRIILYGMMKMHETYGEYIFPSCNDKKKEEACEIWKKQRLEWESRMVEWKRGLDEVWINIRGV